MAQSQWRSWIRALTDRTSCSSPERFPRRATILSTPIKMYRIITDTARMWRHYRGLNAEQCPVPCVKDIEQQRIFLSADDQDALQYALNRNVSAVNMSSVCVGVNAMSITYLDSLINRAYRNGIAISCASGNNGVDVSYCYPACNSKTLAVSSFGQNERAASYSNHGSRIDFPRREQGSSALPPTDFLSA